MTEEKKENVKKKRCPIQARKYRQDFRKRNPTYHREYMKQHRKENPSLYKGADLKKLYWPELTAREAIAEYNRICEAQSNRCAICGNGDKVLHVDHDHNTSRVRALLCGNCNTALGLIKESATVAEKLKTYIEKVCK